MSLSNREKNCPYAVQCCGSVIVCGGKWERRKPRKKGRGGESAGMLERNRLVQLLSYMCRCIYVCIIIVDITNTNLDAGVASACATIEAAVADVASVMFVHNLYMPSTTSARTVDSGHSRIVDKRN